MIMTLDYGIKCRLINNKSHFEESLDSIKETEARFYSKLIECRNRLHSFSLFSSKKTEENILHIYVTYLIVYHETVEQRKLIENKIKFYDEIINSNKVDTEKIY